MSKILVLDKITVDKIAAGEVIERPASVAKELIENAIDSGASYIKTEIRNGGIELIRVTDDGCGIEPEDVRTAFFRHATSKLKSIDDLSGILSLGFRGEALSSIAAVSQVELMTRTAGSLTGVRTAISGGEEISYEEIGVPFGTTIIVRNLFFNTPARAKFLKSGAAEGRTIAAVVEILALSHPEISFELNVSGTEKLFTDGSGDLRNTIFGIYGGAVAGAVAPVDYRDGSLTITGYAGDPNISRGNRNGEIFFVNGRCVKDEIISSAIEQAYQGELMQHRYPFAILNIGILPDQVDVNVHPSKQVVKFEDSRLIYDAVYSAVRNTVQKSRNIPDIEAGARNAAPVPPRKTPENQTESENTAPPREPERPVSRAGGEADPESRALNPDADPGGFSRPEPFEKNRLNGLYPEKREPGTVRETFSNPVQENLSEIKCHIRLIGSVFDTYILAEYSDNFYMIDQHAAHEKILFETFMKRVSQHTAYSQQLMPAAVLTVSPSRESLLEEHADLFAELGFEIEHFGGREYRITAVPYDFFGADPVSLITEILDNDLVPDKGTKQVIRERIALRSCKAAVKAKMRLSDEEKEALLQELFSLEDPYHCPHGRPAVIRMSRQELERKFKRLV